MKSKVRIYIFFILFVFVQINAQQSKLFKTRYQGFVKGDMTLVSNSIVINDEYNPAIKSLLNEKVIKNRLNDECNMKYIDIDSDDSTFSSSSADLILDSKSDKKIVYAGLYWSATYVYESGKMKKSGKFKPINKNREAFDRVKIKLPNQEQYIDLKGELIYDGFQSEEYYQSAPYVMYADITYLVNQSKNPFGTYTVANVKSTIGAISGGISAGWSIFFVYEDPKMTGKFITTFDGFAGITEKFVDIDLFGFQTLPEGNVNAKIAGIALEGDLGLKGDQILFKTSENDKFTQLSNNLRDSNNFFNSSITSDNEFFTHRFPNSSNTLGYDAFISTIDNPNNHVIGNNAQQATVRLKSYGDRYFMFFSAFNVEVPEPERIKDQDAPVVLELDAVKENVKIDKVAFSDSNSIKKIAINKSKKAYKATKTIAAIDGLSKKAKSSQDVPRITIDKSKMIFKNITDTQSSSGIGVSNQKSSYQIIKDEAQIKDYYIIANVFAKQSNATRFIASLKKRGITAKYFINPVNNYRYVYIVKEQDLQVAITLHETNINGQYNGDTWIMTINKQESAALVYSE